MKISLFKCQNHSQLLSRLTNCGCYEGDFQGNAEEQEGLMFIYNPYWKKTMLSALKVKCF